MNIAHQTLIVDINKTDAYQVLEMKQGDKKSRYIDITVTASGSPIVLSSVADEASFAASLSGKLVQLETFTIDADKNVVTVLIDENALALAGTLNCEISLIKDGACITSATFCIKVGASAKGDDAVLFNPSEQILKAFLDAIGWEENDILKINNIELVNGGSNGDEELKNIDNSMGMISGGADHPYWYESYNTGARGPYISEGLHAQTVQYKTYISGPQKGKKFVRLYAHDGVESIWTEWVESQSTSSNQSYIYINTFHTLDDLKSFVFETDKVYTLGFGAGLPSELGIPSGRYTGCYRNGFVGASEMSYLELASFIPDGKSYIVDLNTYTCEIVDTITGDFIYTGFFYSEDEIKGFEFDVNKMYLFGIALSFANSLGIPSGKYTGRYLSPTSDYSGIPRLEFTSATPDGTIYTLNLNTMKVTVENIASGQDFIYAGSFSTVEEFKEFGFKTKTMYMFRIGNSTNFINLGFPIGMCQGMYTYMWDSPGSVISYLEFTTVVPDGKVYKLDFNTNELTVKDADIGQDFIYAGSFSYTSELKNFGFKENKMYTFNIGNSKHFNDLGFPIGLCQGMYTYEWDYPVSDNYLKFTTVVPDGKVYKLDFNTDTLTVEELDNGDFINAGTFHTIESFLEFEFDDTKMYMVCFVGNDFANLGLNYGYYIGKWQQSGNIFTFATYISDGKKYSLYLDTLELTVVDANEKDFIYAGNFIYSGDLKKYEFKLNKLYLANIFAACSDSLGIPSSEYIVKCGNGSFYGHLILTDINPDGKTYILNMDNDRLSVIGNKDYIYAGIFGSVSDLRDYNFEDNTTYLFKFVGEFEVLGFPSGLCQGWYEAEALPYLEWLEFTRLNSEENNNYSLNLYDMELTIYKNNIRTNRFDISEDGELSVVSGDEDELPVDLIIPEVINEIVVNKLSRGMFKGNTRIQSVTFPDTIDEIPDECFNECVNLKYLHNTEHIKKIGSKAFRWTRIEKAIFPNLEEFGVDSESGESLAFSNVPHLAYVDVGKVTEIPKATFKHCTYLSKIVGENVTAVDAEAFTNTYRLANVGFIKQLTSIGDYAFWNTKFNYDWNSVSGLSANATYAQVNPTDFWSEITPTPCTNPLHVMLCQDDPKWANDTFYNGEYTYGAYGCLVMSSIHAVCGLYELKVSSPADFASTVGKSDLWTGFKPEAENSKEVLRNLNTVLNSIPEAYAVETEHIEEGWNAETLSKLYTTLSKGGYAIVETGDPGGHGVLVYGVTDNCELLVIDSECRYPYDKTRPITYKLPINKFLDHRFSFITVVRSKVKVTVVGGTGSGMYPAYQQITVVANAPEEGKKFAYWIDFYGNVKSYDSEYRYFPVKDIVLQAMFYPEDQAINYEILSSVDFIDYKSQADLLKAVFSYSWYCPDGYEFVKAGILAVNKDNLDWETFVAGTTDSNVYERNPNEANNIPVNTYTWTKSNVASGQTWVARAYVQYTDANGELQTVYSNPYEATKE